MSQGFGTSAPKAENGFVRRQIVSSERLRRNIQGEKAWNFNVRRIRGGGLTAPGTNFGCLRLGCATHSTVVPDKRQRRSGTHSHTMWFGEDSWLPGRAATFSLG